MIPYGTDEWTTARLSLVTASRGACLMVDGKGPHGMGEGAITYAKQIVRGMMGIAPDKVTTEDMEEGIRREPLSLKAYGLETFTYPQPGGLLIIPGTIIGATPDAFVDDDGLVEAKNPAHAAHMDVLLSGEVPKKYRVQIQWQLMVSGRDWCDFVSYCPAFGPRALKIIRMEHDREWTANKLMPRIGVFLLYIDELRERMGLPPHEAAAVVSAMSREDDPTNLFNGL